MRRFLKENSLSIVFLALFLSALAGQAVAGHADFNEQQIQHGDPHPLALEQERRREPDDPRADHCHVDANVAVERLPAAGGAPFEPQ